MDRTPGAAPDALCKCTFGLQVQKNAKALAAALMGHGYKLVTDGTENHLILWDLRPEGISGSKMEKACDMCHITLNKNAVVGDLSAMNPGGVRIGGWRCQLQCRAAVLQPRSLSHSGACSRPLLGSHVADSTG